MPCASDKPERLRPNPARGFTLIEVMVALAVVAIGAAALLRLQLVTIVMTDRASRTTAAALLLETKLDEALAGEPPPIGTTEGRFDEQWGRNMAWRMDVSEAAVPGLPPGEENGLRKVRVVVSWDGGSAGDSVEGAVYVAP